ncbi:MAG: DUF5675 family protein [Candidatus Saccharicenans sp.]|jgi:RHS repeat-associated protein|nr:DUF5675 family protein [Candidatus Saccharicenans sp.]MDH7575825.1 DUF5675 family protein [Candidatus Saccharicenans sp.]
MILRDFPYTADQVNSTRVVTDDEGNVVYSAVHDPYGGLQQTWVNTFNPGWKFSGHEQDPESSLYYFGARYYDPGLYRFLSPDPVIPTDRALYNPQRWNLYGYCLGNPINFVDPFGDITIRIWRTLYNNYATYGVYEIELGDTRIWGFTMEPAKGKGKGPIPAGIYEADWFYSEENKELRIKINDIPNFKNIRIHKGNYPGDTTGCILVGKDVNTGGDLLGSGKAMAEIRGGIMDYQMGALKEYIADGELDLELLHRIFDMQVIIYDIPKGSVTVEVTSIRYLMY